MVSLRACRKVLLDGTTFQNSPAWCLHPWACEHVTIRNLTVMNPEYAANGDGLDIDSCKYVNVSDSWFDVGDDAICLKSGRNEAGRKLGKPTEYVTICNCRVYRAHGGFVIGSEMSGGVRHVWVSNCTFMETNAGLRFKSTRGRGGLVEHIHIRNIRMKDIRMEAITFNLYYQGSEKEGDTLVPVDEGTPRFRDISLKDVVCVGSKQSISIQALPEMPLERVEFTDIFISAQEGVYCVNGKDLTFTNVTIHPQQGPVWTFRQCDNVIRH
jgi:polygalacturonase